ncbi:MAG: homocysteine S-methyltransferase family protein [Verrucomicrobia bacterium]|nr:homocysteine S-methyltransferase family protein [Verrucomicrobiota bacterium]
MHPLLEKLLAHRPVVTDGAWGTELQARGLQSGEFPDAWNLSHPDKVLEVARAYVQAGSHIILTNTFGANRVRLTAHDCAGQLAEINRRGVEISKEAAGAQARVFASIGPTGKMLLAGEITEDELRAIFEEQVRALAGAGADGLVVETMAELEEASIAVAAAHASGLPVVGCMVFDSGRNKDRTMTGVTPERAAEGLTVAGADVIGANCGQGIEGFVPICQRLRAATDKPLWMKSNAGLPEVERGRVTYRTTPETFAGYGPALVAAGADFLGGCCGTNPDHIRALKARLTPSMGRA